MRLAPDVERGQVTALGANPIALQIPIGSGDDLEGIIDLVEMRAFFFMGEKGETVEERDIPENLSDDAEMWRSDMIEKAAELDDDLMEKYLDDPDGVTNEQIKAAIRKGTIALECNPVLCGSALKNIGFFHTKGPVYASNTHAIGPPSLGLRVTPKAWRPLLRSLCRVGEHQLRGSVSLDPRCISIDEFSALIGFKANLSDHRFTRLAGHFKLGPGHDFKKFISWTRGGLRIKKSPQTETSWNGLRD